MSRKISLFSAASGGIVGVMLAHYLVNGTGMSALFCRIIGASSGIFLYFIMNALFNKKKSNKNDL